MFDGTIGEWGTEPAELELNPDYKPFSCKNYPVTRINKDTFRKGIQQLVEIVVLTMIQHYKYRTPIFIISKKEGNVSFIRYYSRLNQQLVIKMYSFHVCIIYINEEEPIKY